jgi:hypothetical protein
MASIVVGAGLRAYADGMKTFWACACAVLLASAAAGEKKPSKNAGDEPATVQKLCTLDKLTYSAGAIVKKRDKFIRCQPNGKWRRATKAEMGQK